MKKTYLYGVAALGLLFSACSSDSLSEPDKNLVSEFDQTLYVNMSIHGDSPSTRAASDNGNPSVGSVGEDGTLTDFDEGTSQESAVNNAYFVFYDEDGQVVGDIVPVSLDAPSTVTNEDGTVSNSYKSVVPVSVRKGEKKPTGVICYINPISPSSLQNPLSVIQTVNRERVTTNINGQLFFGMSNSVYYPNDGATTLPQVTVPINPDTQLYKTEAEAKEATDAFVVDVYVDRYAAKLTFSVDESEGKNVPYETASRVYGDSETTFSNNPVVLTFVPQYWALNAQCNSSYVVKSFRRETASGEILADNYSYGLLNYRINIANPLGQIDYGTSTPGATLDAENSWLWNNPAYHRSYWSMSPAYFQEDYPEVASDVAAVEVPNQDYIKYSELSTKGYAVGTDAFKAPHYYKETTVGSKALNGKNPAAAVASVIYVGQYKLSVGGTEVAGNPSFYTYLKGNVTVGSTTEQRPYVYFENYEAADIPAEPAEDEVVPTVGESKVAGGESMLKRFCVQSTILFTYNSTTKEYEELGLDNYSTFVKALHVSEISDAVKAMVDGNKDTKLKLQANARSLQFRSVEAAAGVYIASGNGYKEIVADNAADMTNTQIGISEANAILMQQVGYAYYYNLGEAYFNIPVKHLGWYRPGNQNRTAGKDNPTINWNVVRVGDFGMVRNHSYNVKVNKITGLAAGIAGDNTPIVPPASTDDYFVSYRVNILKWAVVPTQGVDL